MLDYIADLPSIYKEFYSVLRSPGHLVFSIGHPFGDFLRQNEGSYFETRLVSETWRGFGVEVSMLFFRRSLEEIIGRCSAQVSVLIACLNRHRPKQPGFMAIRACKV